MRGQQLFRRRERALGGRAAVLIRRHHPYARMLARECREKPRFARHRARGSFLVAHHDDVALALQQCADARGREPARLLVVGGNEADVAVPTHIRVDDQHRDAAALRLAQDRHERAIVERGQHDAVDPAREEVLHHLDLLVSIVLAHRTLPGHVRSQLAGSFDRPGVNRLPEFVRRPLGDHRDALARGRGRLGGRGSGRLARGLATARHRQDHQPDQRPAPRRPRNHSDTRTRSRAPVKREPACPPRAIHHTARASPSQRDVPAATHFRMLDLLRHAAKVRA
jgi:hypothetical protein